MTADAASVSLQFLPGIGPARAAALAAAGLSTVWDLLHAVPKLLPPAPPLTETGPLPLGAVVRVRARVIAAKPQFMRGRGMSVIAHLERADGMTLKARFFNAGYLRRHLIPGEWYLWEGKTDEKRAGILQHPAFEHLPGGQQQQISTEPACRVAYRSVEGVSERAMADLAKTCLDNYLSALTDPADIVPPSAYQASIKQLHQPIDATQYENARRIIAERELVALAWVMQQRRNQQISAPGKAWLWTDTIQQRALARLPFSLTTAQMQAVETIRADLQNNAPMYRLLNGDVGSGKTAVAFIAMLAVVADKGQAVLLAPTAVLIHQHAAFMSSCLAGSRVNMAILTSATPAAERAEIIAHIADGTLHIVLATHAILHDSIQFSALGLVVIDEQHKFGVEQRATLINRAEKTQGWRPDLLIMTATPIPRTLALTAFGDLAITRIADRPPGRATVTTSVIAYTAMSDLDKHISTALDEHGQIFIICPLRDSSERVTAADATQVHAHISKKYGDVPCGLLHGAINESDKISLMDQFNNGSIRILVATTVVEVGIDVPAATLLIVLDADRFGLAQLHQLRGRLGRGHRPGQCVLFYRDTPKKDLAATNDKYARLHLLVEHEDGLAIAEADLQQRGAGQLLGTGQHGATSFRVAALPRDLDLLSAAHDMVRHRIADGHTASPILLRLITHGDAGILAGG